MTQETPTATSSQSSEKDHDSLRQRIIESCIELVRNEGIGGLSMRQIAEEADTTTQMIYTLFGKKKTLIERIYQEGSERLLERYKDIDPDLPPLERLFEMGNVYRDFALKNKKLYEAMYSSELANKEIVKRTAIFDVTAEALQECFDRGILKNGDPETITESFWGAIHGAIGLEIAGYYSDETTAREAYLEIRRAVLDGYRIEEPTTEVTG